MASLSIDTPSARTERDKPSECERGNKGLRLRLTISGNQHFWRMPFGRRALHKYLEAMLSQTCTDTVSLDLVLVRDGEMTLFNEQFMKSHGPTNILSFPLDESDPEGDGSLHLGSLVFSVDTLHREVLLYGQDIREHCLRLFAHGLGHLHGLDHSPEMDELCHVMWQAALAVPDEHSPDSQGSPC